MAVSDDYFRAKRMKEQEEQKKKTKKRMIYNIIIILLVLTIFVSGIIGWISGMKTRFPDKKINIYDTDGNEVTITEEGKMPLKWILSTVLFVLCMAILSAAIIIKLVGKNLVGIL